MLSSVKPNMFSSKPETYPHIMPFITSMIHVYDSHTRHNQNIIPLDTRVSILIGSIHTIESNTYWSYSECPSAMDTCNFLKLRHL